MLNLSTGRTILCRAMYLPALLPPASQISRTKGRCFDRGQYFHRESASKLAYIDVVAVDMEMEIGNVRKACLRDAGATQEVRCVV